MSTLEYDSEIEQEAMKIVKSRKSKVVKEPEPIKEPIIVDILPEPAKLKPKRERSAKQKEATEKMRQKLLDAHNNKKKLAEERDIEEEILLSRIKERATKKTIKREISKKVKQLDLDSDTDNIIEPVHKPKQIVKPKQVEADVELDTDTEVMPFSPKPKVKTTRKPRTQKPKPIAEPVQQHSAPIYSRPVMKINFV
jgi:phosphoribosyl-AMP cyclohydrolase